MTSSSSVTRLTLLQALFNLDFASALSALPPPPHLPLHSLPIDPSSPSPAPAAATIDDPHSTLRQFARENLQSIIQECIGACRRSGGLDVDNGSKRNGDRKALVEKLVMWTIRARQLGWVDGDDAHAAADLKMLWGWSCRPGEQAAAYAIDDDPERSFAALPTASSSSTPTLLSSLASQHEVFRACLVAAAGDGQGVVSAAEAMHCRCVAPYKPRDITPSPSFFDLSNIDALIAVILKAWFTSSHPPPPPPPPAYCSKNMEIHWRVMASQMRQLLPCSYMSGCHSSALLLLTSMLKRCICGKSLV